MKDALNTLSTTISRQKAFALLHSMAASNDVLFWIPRGQLLRNQRIIPVTNISELEEYVFLSYNDDLAKPRALNTFLDGLAELGIDKGFMKNKKVLSDLLEKEKDYQDKEEEETNSGNKEDEVYPEEEEKKRRPRMAIQKIRCQLKVKFVIHANIVKVRTFMIYCCEMSSMFLA